MRSVCAVAFTALAAVSLYGCGGDGTTTPSPAPAPSPATLNIVQLAESVDDLSTLVTLLVSHNLTDTLSGTGPFTVFAPTNDAFDAANATIATLTTEQITEVLTYHVVPGVSAVAADLKQDESLPTVFSDHNLTVQTITPDVTIHPDGTGAADATVTKANNMATNGVVHIVNKVLVPSLPAPAPTPTPNATTPAPGPAPTPTPNATTPAPGPAPLPTIVELAQATPTLSTLVSLLVSHNLTDTLSGTGPFTVFAPTDDAFAAANDTIAKLTPEEITEVLTYHVVPTAAKAADLTQDESLSTVFAGHSLTVQTPLPTVTIHPDGADAADATVTQADNMASNGVVHIVNAVLVPNLATFNVQVV